MACARCLLPYPDELLNPIMAPSHKDHHARVCGICALQIVNETHGTSEKRFHGEMAEDFRQRALGWRRKHTHATAVTE